MKKHISIILVFIFIGFMAVSSATAQQNSTTHTRGKLWETLYNDGFIGDGGAWDYLQVTGIGFYPGFKGYIFPNNEETANGFITDANFHNFRTGPWIIAKDAEELVPPDYSPKLRDYLLYHASLTSGDWGVIASRAKPRRTENFNGQPNFNPLLPEEINYIWFHTATGITVKQRSMTWSYPGYSDFIIYDYTFTNTGIMAIPAINQVKTYQQILNEVWIVFHSGLQCSTKGMLNFHYNDDFLASAAPAGGFGWHPGSGYSDYYGYEDRETTGNDRGLLYYSYDFNGGREPVPWDRYGIKSNWQERLRLRPEWEPELQDPSAFGFVFLYNTPPPGSVNGAFEPDPTYFNIYSDEGEKFNGKDVDFEGFGTNRFKLQGIYDYATHEHYAPNTNGDGYFWYTSSFGPYNLAPGDSVRLIVAEVAGMLDIHDAVSGDTLFTYPDSTLAAIRRNAEAARRAVKWALTPSGDATVVNGIKVVADVPEPPPAPECKAITVSAGTDTAIISVRWDDNAEKVQFTDGSGGIFYDGATDLSGYRIYRGIDKRGVWTLLKDIDRTELDQYWNDGLGTYEYQDKDLQFGFEFYYYVQAYNDNPRPWTSINGTLVPNVGELASADNNHTDLIAARPGPVSIANGWDVFVAPNPFVEGDPARSFGSPTPDKIEFRNLPEAAVLKIFSISGDLIRTIKHGPDDAGNLFGSLAWDQRTDSGLRVAPGLYIYVVESETPGLEGKRTRGKLMIIR